MCVLGAGGGYNWKTVLLSLAANVCIKPYLNFRLGSLQMDNKISQSNCHIGQQ